MTLMLRHVIGFFARSSVCAGFLAVLAGACCLRAAEPFIEKVDLFEARKGGYHTYRIPGVVVTKNGTVLAFCEARKDGTGDWVDIDILMRRSTDGGRTWSGPTVMADAGELPTHNAAAIVDHEGTIHFLNCVNYARAFYRKSTDDGLTFSESVEIAGTFEPFKERFLWNVIATGPGHGIQLRKGRLIVPVWLSNGGKRHRPSVCSVIYSDDLGKTWKPGDLVPFDYVNMSETVAVELEDGSVMLNIRNEDRGHRRAISVSKDGAHRWSAPTLHPDLKEPVCMANIIRYNFKAGDEPGRILFSNPDNLEYTGKLGRSYDKNRDRVNLTIKMSTDDGKTWPVSRVLEAGISAYSDLAIAEGGDVLCLYERAGVNSVMWDTKYVTLARFNLAWLCQPKPNQSCLPVNPPADAVVLFDGGQAVHFRSMAGTQINWPVKDGTLVSTRGEAAPGKVRSNHIVSTYHFRDADIHVEFMLPDDKIGNSGIYIHGNYEVQILNSFGVEKLTQDEMGAIYGFAAPLVNAARKPGVWQVYDIRYRAPRRDASGKIVEEGSLTVWLNGQLVQDNTRFGEPRSRFHPFRYGNSAYLNRIGAQQKATMTGPLFLQDHDAAVRFRNVWVRPLDDKARFYDEEK